MSDINLLLSAGDTYEMPFHGDIIWEDFSIKWPMEDVSMDLYYFLLSVPREKLYRLKMEALLRLATTVTDLTGDW